MLQCLNQTRISESSSGSVRKATCLRLHFWHVATLVELAVISARAGKNLGFLINKN